MNSLGRTAALAGIAVTCTAGADDWSGDVLVGWRNVSIDGAENRFRQHIDLTNGTRLLGLQLEYQADDSTGRAPDQVRVEMANLGGDPFQSIAVSVRKFGDYDFRYGHRKSTYFYDDLLIDPADASIEGSTGGDFHRFDVEREHDSVSLGVHMTTRGLARLAFDRYRRHGDSTSTRDVQRDEFELEQAIDEVHEVVTVGFDYHWDAVGMSVEHRIRDFDSNNALLLPGFSTGLNPDDPTTLDFYFYEQPYGYDSNETQVRFNSRSANRLEWRLSASTLDLDLDSALLESAQGIDFLGVAFAGESGGDVRVEQQLQKYDLDSSYLFTERLRVNAGLRYRRLDQQGRLNSDTASGSGDWDLTTIGVDLGFDIDLADNLAIAVGWSGERRDTDTQVAADAVVNTTIVDTDRSGFFARVDYRPADRVELRGVVEKNSVDDPLTLASATDLIHYRLRARVRVGESTKVTLTHKVKDHDNDNNAWSFRSQQTGLRLSYHTNRWQLALGAASVDLDRDYQRLVSGGFRQDTFQANYRGDTQFIDGAVDFTATDSIRLGGAIRYYDNDGSFATNRRDANVYIEYRLPQDYSLRLSYRNVDYNEDLEDYAADIVQLGIRLNW